MKTQASTSIHSPDLAGDFERDTTVLLRKRFLWFLGVWGAVILVVFLMTWGGHWAETTYFKRDIPLIGLDDNAAKWTPQQRTVSLVGCAALLMLYGSTFLTVRWALIPRNRLVSITMVFIVLDGMIDLGQDLIGHVTSVGVVTLTHVIAAMFLPWTLKQAAWPMIVIVLANFLACLLFKDISDPEVWPSLAATPLMIVPGPLVAWLKYTRRLEKYKFRALSKRFGEFSRELLDARKIHEALFPKPRSTGPVRFWYEYEPMRGIGGDFVFASCPPQHHGNRLHLVLLDVTGHGIAAALTVNRLCGELERVYGENPDARPGEVLRLLNRYIHLTMSHHSIYATALCVAVDCKADELEYASGGHPPAFLRGVDGTLHDLDSTAMVLGVSPHADFDPAPRKMRFCAGDAVLAYTDGAIEARNDDGKILGVAGMRNLVAGTPAHVAMMARRSLSNRPIESGAGAWARTIVQRVESHRSGAASDDTLIVEISRPIGRPASSPGTVPGTRIIDAGAAAAGAS